MFQQRELLKGRTVDERPTQRSGAFRMQRFEQAGVECLDLGPACNTPVSRSWQENASWAGLSAGLAYDTSAVSDENRTLSLPMGEAYRVGLGVQWQVSKAISLGAAYEFMWAGDMPVSQGEPPDSRVPVSGSFNDSWFSFFDLNLTWKF